MLNNWDVLELFMGFAAHTDRDKTQPIFKNSNDTASQSKTA